MKRFSAREMVLLCSPLLVVGVAGWLLSRRKAPPLPHVKFRVDTPTILEAWDGGEVTLVLTNAPNEILDEMLQVRHDGRWVNVNDLASFRSFEFFPGRWCKSESMGSENRYAVNLDGLPLGPVRFGIESLVPTRANPNQHIKQFWLLDRSRIRPFAFSKMAQKPLIVLRSVKVTRVFPGTSIHGECAFDLTGVAMGARTPVDFMLSGGGYGSGKPGSSLTSGISWLPSTPKNHAPRRVCEWTVEVVAPGVQTICRVHGRVSADNRWPLAFQVEPFDMAKVKVGQSLRFKAWPAPIPKGAG